jgi:hypothetical protein
MDVESIRSRLGSQPAWEQRPDGWWLIDPELDVRAMVRLMVEAQARLVTITGRPARGGECCLAYHWDQGGELLTFVTLSRAGSAPSIAAVCPAADWAEREIHDYFAVDFAGRDDLDPLVLRPGDPPGLFHSAKGTYGGNGRAGGEP